MKFLKKLFGIKTFQIRLEEPFTIEFYYNEDFNEKVNLNDEVNLWTKPNVNEIRAYPKKYIGYVGSIQNETIKKHLDAGGKHEARIIDINDDIVTLKIILKNSFQAKGGNNSEQTINKRLQEIKKPYKPKSKWTLRFRIDNFDASNGYYLSIADEDIITNNTNDLQKLVWLEDNFGDFIEYANASSPKDLIKTLRAKLSNVQLNIEYVESLGDYHYFEINPNS